MLSSLIGGLRERRQGLRKIGLGAAIVIFTAGFILAIRATPQGMLEVRFAILIPYALFLPPLTYLLQSIELTLTAKAVGVRLNRKQASEIVLYSNVATFLPIPGGLLTRTAALRANGVPVARSATAVLLFTGIAGTVAFAYAGLWVIASQPIMGTASLMIAAIGATICSGIARRLQVASSVIGQAVTLRIATTIYESLCFVIIFAAIGAPIALNQAAVLVVSGFIAMALTIFPSGIGVREGIVALLSPLVGIDPATGFLAAATMRIVALAWMILLSILVLFWRSEIGEQQEE